jgi:NADPH-dependent 2,4-dienoyl-CoA reductase/sulfur reductase-like enzyme
MKVAIIGNGISGITAARFIRKLDEKAEITVISDESEYFFSRTALMYVYMGHLRLQDTQPYENWFWEKNRIKLLRGRVESIDFDAKLLIFKDKNIEKYDKLIIATGSKSNKFGWKGQDLDGVHGLYHLQDLEAMERHSKGLKRAVVIGGGLIGIEMAEMFHARHIPVTFVVRESSFWNLILPAEESAMINRHIDEHGFDLRLESELSEILDENGDGKADAVILKSGEKIECGFVGLTVGVSPNVDFLRNTPLKINRGIVVNDYLETNIKDVFALGDCAEIEQPQAGRRPIEAIWYTGKMMGETVAYTVCGKPQKYVPRLWFNSAKFLDIEYQVYGDIRPQLADNQATIYWEHPDGKKSIRITFEKNTESNEIPNTFGTEKVVGFNLMGLRYRHEVCEKWILEKTPIETVLQNLGLANFDPEFYKEYEEEIVKLYNKNFNKNLQLKTKRGLNAVTRFLKSVKLKKCNQNKVYP